MSDEQRGMAQKAIMGAAFQAVNMVLDELDQYDQNKKQAVRLYMKMALGMADDQREIMN